jgi:hypothetical protein
MGVGKPSLRFIVEGFGVTSILEQTLIMMCILMYPIIRWKLAFGSITFLVTVGTILSCFMATSPMVIIPHFVIPAFIAGLIGDVLYYYLKPSLHRLIQLQIFSFIFPIVFNSGYFISLYYTNGLWISDHIITGLIVESGIEGFFISYLLKTAVEVLGHKSVAPKSKSNSKSHLVKKLLGYFS